MSGSVDDEVPVRRVLLVAQRFHPAHAVAAVRWTAIASLLPEEGIDLGVACRRYPGDGVGQDGREVFEVTSGEVDGETVNISASGMVDAPARMTRARLVAVADRLVVPDLSTEAWRRQRKALLEAAECYDPDVIVSTGPPHGLHLVGMWLARRLDRPLVVDLRDPYLGSPRGDWPRIPPWRQLNRFLERRYIESASEVMTAGEGHARALAHRYPSLAERVHHVPNGFYPSGKKGQADRRRSDGETIELGVVSTASSSELEKVVRGARQAWPDRRVVLRAFGFKPAALDHLRSTVEVVDEGWISTTELGDALVTCDLLLLVLAEKRSEGGGTSTKLYQYIDTGRPILAVNPYPADEPLLERWASHRALRDPSDADCARALHALHLGGSRPRSAEFADRYGWPSLAGRVAAVLKRAATR